MIIDWNEAPNGATHYSEGRFYLVDGENLSVWNGRGWALMIGVSPQSLADQLIERPQP